VQRWWHTGLPFTWPVAPVISLVWCENQVPFSQHNPAYHPYVCFHSVLVSELPLTLKIYWPTPKTTSTRYSYIILESREKKTKIMVKWFCVLYPILWTDIYSGSNVLTAVTTKRSISWDVTRCSPIEKSTFQRNILAGDIVSLCTLKIVAIWSSETLVDFHRTTWHYIVPHDENLHKYLFDLSKILTGADNYVLMLSVWRMGFSVVISWLI
jgi:hypothetical protein